MDSKQTRNNQRFSVIIRPRQGIPCALTPLEISMEITEQLKQYGPIFNVGFSPPNFAINFTSLELQLHLLSVQALTGPGFTLDILPWSYEYETFEFPWIPVTSSQDIDLTNKPGKTYLQNLIGQPKPLQRHISAIICSDQMIKPKQGEALDESKIYMYNSKIPAPILYNFVTGQQKKILETDFSYLMILELKDFYYAKFDSFRRCKELCRDICEIAQLFYNDFSPMIQPICKDTDGLQDTLSEEVNYYISDFIESLNYETLYIAEELVGLGFTLHPMYEKSRPPLSLASYKKQNSSGQIHTPFTLASFLKKALNISTEKIYGTAAAVKTEKTKNGYLCTHISVASLHHKYMSANTVTVDEAEANSIYRFLKYATNKLAYNIVDQNYPTLLRLVSEINNYNVGISELELCARKACTIISEVQKDIENMHHQLTKHVDTESIPPLSSKIKHLLSWIQNYSIATDHALQCFNHNKEKFKSTRLQPIYRSIPDES